MQAARRGGKIVHCGVTSGAEAEVNISALYWNHLTIMGSTMGSHEEFRQMTNAVGAMELIPVIDSTFALDDIREGQGRMERGEQFGKIVITI
jgi:zinc-binding alcohol dehydrogenase/oxidoreductase